MPPFLPRQALPPAPIPTPRPDTSPNPDARPDPDSDPRRPVLPTRPDPAGGEPLEPTPTRLRTPGPDPNGPSAVPDRATPTRGRLGEDTERTRVTETDREEKTGTRDRSGETSASSRTGRADIETTRTRESSVSVATGSATSRAVFSSGTPVGVPTGMLGVSRVDAEARTSKLLRAFYHLTGCFFISRRRMRGCAASKSIRGSLGAADTPVIGTIPSDFPVETLAHVSVEAPGRGYAMIPNNQVGDSSKSSVNSAPKPSSTLDLGRTLTRDVVSPTGRPS